ncbi:transposase [Amycolatopsis sp. SID8362]|uniref:transposase n=1 Tax=Amycolatopsis sp. SID8362 TaxID=2690346 RepID=UPI001941EF8B
MSTELRADPSRHVAGWIMTKPANLDPADQHLEQWMTAAEADDLPALRSFVKGLRRVQDAVVARVTLPWSSGVVEGHVNRIKILKRQMFAAPSNHGKRARTTLARVFAARVLTPLSRDRSILRSIQCSGM